MLRACSEAQRLLGNVKAVFPRSLHRHQSASQPQHLGHQNAAHLAWWWFHSLKPGLPTSDQATTPATKTSSSNPSALLFCYIISYFPALSKESKSARKAFGRSGADSARLVLTLPWQRLSCSLANTDGSSAPSTTCSPRGPAKERRGQRFAERNVEALRFFSKETLGTKGRIHFTRRQNGFGLDKRQAGAPTSQDQTHKEKRTNIFYSTHMRLLGGILRPSLYQVTCGWGKLRIRGAGMTAPSP